MPVGYMYWLIPALFFKVFGAQLITLIKAQVFINIIGGLAFRSIFKFFKSSPADPLCRDFLFVLSYSFPNYWPWYNHTVIIYELIALAFLIKYFTGMNSRFSYLFIILVRSFYFLFVFYKTRWRGAWIVNLYRFTWI